MTHLEMIQTKLQEQSEMYKEAIQNGSAADFAQYKQGVGVVHGLKIASEIVREQIELANRDER